MTNHETEVPTDSNVLNSLEAIRRRPVLYVGDTGARGLHRLVFTALDHAVSRAHFGLGDCITVILNADGSCTVEDKGPGLPVNLDQESSGPTSELTLTKLAADGPRARYLTIIDAASAWVKVRTCHRGQAWAIGYKRGRPAELTRGKCYGDFHGTRIRFRPDPRIFTTAWFSVVVISRRLEELSHHYPGLMCVIEKQKYDQDTPRPAFLCGRGTRMWV